MKYGGQEGYKSQYLYQNEKLICSTLVQKGEQSEPSCTKVPRSKVIDSTLMKKGE